MTYPLTGYDLSKWQTTTPDLTGRSFVGLKVSEGTTKDPMFDTHYANARKAGLLVIGYHFGTDDAVVPVAKQVPFFLSASAGCDLVVLDQEASGFDDPEAQAFIDGVRKARSCGLYHSSCGYAGVDADFDWVADYRAEAIAANAPQKCDLSGTLARFDIWQWSTKPLDQDYMKPSSPLVRQFRVGYVSPEAYAAKAALDQAQIDNLQVDLDSSAAQVATLQAQLAASQGALSTAVADEKERIALVVGSDAANRIRSV